MVAELAMGRRGKGSAIATMNKLTDENDASSSWHVIGWLSIVIPLIGLSFYSVVAGWSVDYIIKAAANSFSQFDAADSDRVFKELLASPLRLLLFHSIFVASAVFVVARGITRGIEVIAKSKDF